MVVLGVREEHAFVEQAVHHQIAVAEVHSVRPLSGFSLGLTGFVGAYCTGTCAIPPYDHVQIKPLCLHQRLPTPDANRPTNELLITGEGAWLGDAARPCGCSGRLAANSTMGVMLAGVSMRATAHFSRGQLTSWEDLHSPAEAQLLRSLAASISTHLTCLIA